MLIKTPLYSDFLTEVQTTKRCVSFHRMQINPGTQGEIMQTISKPDKASSPGTG